MQYVKKSVCVAFYGKKRKINEELRNYLNVEAKYIKKYATLEYIAENNITLVTDEKQINDKIVIDEIKTLALENLNKKINIFLKEKNMERDCLEELYNFVLQEKIKIKVYILK